MSLNNFAIPDLLFKLDDKIYAENLKDFQNDPKSLLGNRACFKHDLLEMCTTREVATVQHVFSNRVELEGKPITNQRSTGRCWIFAALNTIRPLLCKKLNIEEFEFSQAYLFFWDKIERCNFFLNQIVVSLKKGEKIDGRLMSFLLEKPIEDGGQWDMLVNLINKYGLIPKKCYPESYSSENSSRLNSILKTKLREHTHEIQEKISAGISDGELTEMISGFMKQIYKVVAITLGPPPSTFTWQFYDKSKSSQTIGPLSPLEFYINHVKPVYNVDEKVCLVNDPRENSPYGRPFTVDCLGNIVDGRPVRYNNQPIEVLIKAAADSIKAGEMVWFGCDVFKFFSSKFGVQNTDMVDYNLLFGDSFNPFNGLSRANRLVYGDSAMTHAMSITSCHYNNPEDPEPVKWRCENSWGEDRGEKGFICFTNQWFREFVYEIVVDRSFLTPEILSVDEKPVITLPAWDPMGSLAINRIKEQC